MKTPKGKQAFIEYYQSYFPDEMDDFLASLEHKQLPVLRFHPSKESELKSLWEAHNLNWKTLDWYPHALVWPKEIQKGTKLPGFDENLIYPMSPASLLPVIALDLQTNDQILDACAAPGGKALAMTSELRYPSQILANDLSYKRSQRMRRAFHDFDASDIRVTTGPAEKIWQQYPNHFDKILLDAPCSSEQHVWNSAKHLAEWSPKRPQKLAKRQVVLIETLFKALKPGGRLVYSTCAITPEENESVVQKVLESNQHMVELIPFDWSAYPHGATMNNYEQNPAINRLIPHRDNSDPMFIAVFKKNI